MFKKSMTINVNNYGITMEQYQKNISARKFQQTYKAKTEQNTVFNQQSEKFSIPVLLATVMGTLIPIFAIRKYQNRTLKSDALKDLYFPSKAKKLFKSFNINYGLKEMLFTSFGSVLGGLLGGLLFKKDENKKTKIKESVFQVCNIAIPTSIVAGLLKITEKNKKLKGVLPKILSVAIGIGAGMPIAAMVSNNINNGLVDKENPNIRNLKLKDCFVHIDDLVGALVLARIPFADKLHVDKILPVLYGVCGYEAGVKN